MSTVILIVLFVVVLGLYLKRRSARLRVEDNDE